MNYQQLLTDARTQARALDERLHGRVLRGDQRSRAAAACFAVAQQHHSAILVLLSHPNPLLSSAFALLRPLLEATLRGHWIAHCATDAQAQNLISGAQKQIDMATIVRSITAAVGLEKEHPDFYRRVWPDLSAFLHTYNAQVQAWVATDDVEASYSEEQLCSLVTLASKTVLLAEQGVLSLEHARAV